MCLSLSKGSILSRSIKIRLAVMMFMQFFIIGATMPIMSLYLKGQLGFSGVQAGLVLSMYAISAFIAPLVGAFIADRFMTAERMLSMCHFFAGCFMLVLSYQHSFGAVLAVYLFYVLSIGSTTALTNAVAFHHTPEAKSNFGGVRVWGTIGWVVVAWFAFFWLGGTGDGKEVSRLPDMLKLSAISSFVFSAYALTLPRSFALTHKPKSVIPVESFRVLIQPKILLVGGLAFLLAVCNKYYYFGMGPFLTQLGVSERAIMPFMSIGQTAEIFAMFALGMFLRRYGFKAVMTAGIIAQSWRFVAFAFFGSPAVLASGIVCHGINFAFFMTAALIFVDGRCDKASRTGVHQLIAILNGGLGSIVGNMLAGKAADHFTDVSGMINFKAYWSIPLVITIVCLVIALVFVPRDHIKTETQIEFDDV